MMNTMATHIALRLPSLSHTKKLMIHPVNAPRLYTDTINPSNADPGLLNVVRKSSLPTIPENTPWSYPNKTNASWHEMVMAHRSERPLPNRL